VVYFFISLRSIYISGVASELTLITYILIDET